MKKKSKTSGQRWKFKKKEYKPRPEVEGQGLLFGPSDIEKALLARKEKGQLTVQERQAIRKLQGAGGIE